MVDRVYTIVLERQISRATILCGLSFSPSFLALIPELISQTQKIRLVVSHTDFGNVRRSLKVSCVIYLLSDQVAVSIRWFQTRISLSCQPSK